jgi:hypothetical protein
MRSRPRPLNFARTLRMPLASAMVRASSGCPRRVAIFWTVSPLWTLTQIHGAELLVVVALDGEADELAERAGGHQPVALRLTAWRWTLLAISLPSR